ncbi:flagellar hook-basal body protein [Dyella ginsengisoli]|uniref:flagellar hook-basal body protein n=1 Tax=Dyella ginsengisoli TaxID=363848 RepID=UPI00047615C5|nr:flagellar hook basal-body protein [Dyella ginsengisoli]
MDATIASITRALGHDVDALNVTSQNVANLRTPGYRARQLLPDFSARLADAAPVSMSMADGPLEATGRSLDVALQGQAFLTVQVGGNTLLMRAGQLGVDASGQLVDPQGHPVLGQGGPIHVHGADASVGADGSVRDGGKVIDHLRIVDITQPELLQAAGDGLYAYAGDTADWNGTLHVGELEQSNVDPASEMVHLMTLTRHAQSLQHAMQAYDEVMQAGINHLGENS